MTFLFSVQDSCQMFVQNTALDQNSISNFFLIAKVLSLPSFNYISLLKKTDFLAVFKAVMRNTFFSKCFFGL